MSKLTDEPPEGAEAVLASASDIEPAEIGANLRRLRREQGYSLDALARPSNVSRAMLGQIETGKSVPTVTLVWRIARALGVSVSTLIGTLAKPRAVVLPKARARLLTSSDGRFTMRAFTSQEIQFGAEFFELRLASGHREPMGTLPPGACASLAVASGAIEVRTVDGEALRLAEGDAVLVEAEAAQSYFNPGDSPAVAFLVIAPARKAST